MKPQIRPAKPLALLALCWTLFTAPAVSAQDWLYTVRPDDRLWALADKFCGDPSRWQALAQYNQLANSTDLQVGSQLKIPLDWLIEQPAVVQLVYFRGDVRVVTNSVEQMAIRGHQMIVGSVLTTGADSYANIRFADGSSMQIGPDSEVAFDTLSAFRDTGMVDSRIRINRGSSNSTVEPQRGPGSVYRISTPLGVAAVRGTRFRTRADGEISFVETTEGAVEFIAPGGSSDIDLGYGLKAAASGVSIEELLPAPELAPEPVYDNNGAVSWEPLKKADEYIVRIYASPAMQQVIAQAKVPEPEYQLAGLGDGSYAFGVRAVAASGLQGFEGTQPLKVAMVLPAPSDIRTRHIWGSRDVSVSWEAVPRATRYAVIATPAAGGEPVQLETTDTSVRFEKLAHAKWDITVRAFADEHQGELSDSQGQSVSRRILWLVGGLLVAGVVAL